MAPSNQRPTSAREAGARVYEALTVAATAMSVRELVAVTGLHENAVRRNLDALIHRGDVHVERSSTAPRGRGRPTLRYRAVGSRDVPYRRVLPLVLELLAGTAGGAQRAYELGRSEGRRSSPSADAREALIASLAELGFGPVEEASEGRGPDSITIRLSRCPFADIVQAPPAAERLCALHHGLIAGEIEAHGGRLVDFAIVNPKIASCRVRLRGSPQAPTELPPRIEPGGDSPPAQAERPKRGAP